MMNRFETYFGANYTYYTRGIWKVLSMVFYLSNLFTNPIMFDIILKNYFSSTVCYGTHFMSILHVLYRNQ